MISESELKRIVDLAKSVPEEFRQKCFELLLDHALQTREGKPIESKKADTPPAKPAPEEKGKFQIPIDVRAFLTQYGLDQSLLWKLFHAEGTEVRPIYTLKSHKKARAQIEHALMMCLESAMRSGKFVVSLDDLRARCTDHKCYDAPNFMRNLKAWTKLFKKVETDQPLVLTADGKSELAELIETLKS